MTGTVRSGELRRLAVVLVDAPATPPTPAAALAMDLEALRQASAPYGGHVEPLEGGAAAIVLEAERQVATDHAAAAARCALAVAERAPGRRLALALGRAASASPHPAREAIERAARLLAHGSPDARAPVVIDEVVAGLLDARFDVVEREAGFALRGERALAEGARTLLGRPTACVGRDWELDALAAILDECAEERRARAAVVTAPAGMGKSRLAAELVGRLRRRPDEVEIWVGRGDSLRAGATLDLLAQALRDGLGVRGRAPLAERHERIRARVAEHVPAADAERVTVFLAELVGAPFPEGGDLAAPTQPALRAALGAALRAARGDAHLMSEQMRRAWLDFLGAEAAARPVLIVLEDLHWGDFGTVRFIELALRERRELPFMVLALARPDLHEKFPRLWAERNVQEIRLPKLGRKASERLARQVLGDVVAPESLEGVVERIVERSEGNAFYLEELIRAAAAGQEALPETVLAMVEARLAILPQPARRVLRAASVFGEACWEGGVAAVLGGELSGASVAQWISTLTEQEVLVVRPAARLPGERELAFRHALLREGAYATWTDDDRRAAHRRAGAWLEAHGEEDPVVLAGHFERGGEGARAARYYLRAAQLALHVLDLPALLTRTSQGLACATAEAEAHGAAELRHALLGVRCEASAFVARVPDEAVRSDAAELMRAARPGGVPWSQAVIPHSMSLFGAGRVGEFRAVLGALRTAEPAPEAVKYLAVAHISAINMLDLLGEIAEGNAFAERLAEVLGPPATRTPRGRVIWSALLALRAGHAFEAPWDGLRHCERMRELHAVLGGERTLLSMQLFRGLNLWYLGAAEPAEETLAALPAMDEMMGPSASLRRFVLAWLRAGRGALDLARAGATELAEAGRAHRDRIEEGRGRWALAEVLRRDGDLAGADRELATAGPLVPASDQPGLLATLTRLRLAQGRADDARAVAEDAAARYTAMGGCGLFRGADVRLARAEALHAAGDAAEARHAIIAARARLRVMADQIGEPAYRRSFLEGVPENARTMELARAWLGEAAD